jgi:large subunit ribosomal protein L29
MSKQHAKSYQDMKIAELHKELLTLRRDQFNLRMQRATGDIPRPNQFGLIRKNIARIKTILSQKQRAGSEA